jgi:hypothetical protein
VKLLGLVTRGDDVNILKLFSMMGEWSFGVLGDVLGNERRLFVLTSV